MAFDLSTVRPLSTEVSQAITQPFEKAFAGSGCLYASSSESDLTRDYRWAFEEPGSSVSTSPRWQDLYGETHRLAYDPATGVSTKLMSETVKTLEKWREIRDLCECLARINNLNS